MSTSPPESGEITSPTETYCYAHPKTPTRLRCTRCDRPICGRCAIPASVGQHCPECVAEARRSAPKVRTVMASAAPAVMAIIAIDVAFFLAQNAGPQLFGFNLTHKLGMSPPAIACNGEWWRLLTPMVLHAGLLHIFLNMYVLFIYGPNVEQAFGSTRFVAMYVISGFMGSAFSYGLGEPFKLGVGASGAIFGMVGVLLVYLYRRRASALMNSYMRGILLFIALNLFIGFALSAAPGAPRIDNLAHLGGLAAGVALGAGFDRPGTRNALRVQALTAAGVIAAGVVLVVLGGPALPARECSLVGLGF